MYRPLYWFGKGATPNLEPVAARSRSNPTYSNGQHRDVKLKSYKWSNGETVTAQQVVFWLNMMKVEKLELGRLRARHDPGRHQVDHRRRPDASRSR